MATQTMKLTVNIANSPYEITIGERVIANAGELLQSHFPAKKAIVVTDENVAKLYLHRLTNAFASVDVRVAPIILPAGEQTKSFANFSHLVDQVLSLKPDRKTTLVALGGGVVGDITGFAASVVLRGIPFIQIPTTLLAQVDSSVGGKTGINTAYGKNIIGSFYQPKAVLIDVLTLETLPKREKLAGYAEVLKYGIINNKSFFGWLEENGKKIITGDPSLQQQAIEESCRAKAEIVVADEKETKDLRALLNFGHTFGHALEAETGYGAELLHGEAVAIGMVMAAKLSCMLGYCGNEVAERIAKHLSEIGLKTSIKELAQKFSAKAMMEHFSRDKKAENDGLTFILLKNIGEALVAKNVDANAVLEFIVKELE